MRLRNAKGQFISKEAETMIREIAEEKGAKNNEQNFFLQNEREFDGLFSATNEAKFDSKNGPEYINSHFDKFAVNNGDKTYNISRGEAMALISGFQNYINFKGGNFAVFTGDMKSKDKNGMYHKLEINLPVEKQKNGTFKFSDEKLKEMEENDKIQYYKIDKKHPKHPKHKRQKGAKFYV